MKLFPLLLWLFLATALFGADGQEDYRIAFGPRLLLPVAGNNVFEDLALGVHVRYKHYPWLAFMADYYYFGKEYYGFDHSSDTWFGPAPYSLVSEGGPEPEWIFFHTEHYLGLRAAGALRFEDFEFLGGMGPSFVFLAPSDAVDTYPEFKTVYDDSSKSWPVFMGWLFSLGGEYRFHRYFTAGLEFLFTVDHPLDFFGDLGRYGIGYFRTNGNLNLCVNCRF